MLTVRLFAFLLLLLWTTGCRWAGVNSLAQQLRCGLSVEEVRRLAEGSGAKSFRAIERPNQYVTHVLDKGMTFIEFSFDPSGLKTFRVGHSRPFTTTTTYEARVNLCTGERTGYVSLTVKVPKEYGGGTIYVDGREYGFVGGPPGYQFNIAVPWGEHRLSVVKTGQPELLTTVSYPSETRQATLELQPR